MKTKVMYLATKMTVAVVLVAIIAIKAFAGGTPNLKLVPHSAERAIVVVNFEDAISELTIEDVKGDIVYYKEGKIDAKMYSKIFDFKNLSDGEYKIIAKNKFGKKVLIFKVEKNNVTVVNNKLASDPFIEVKNNVLRVSYLNQDEANIRFTIENEDGIFFNKALGDEFNITTGFNIAKLTEGDYKANISDGINIFSYSFEK